MACGATLKRTLDFDPLLSPASPKRRRCAPLSAPASAAASPAAATAAAAASAAAASPQKYLRMEPSPFGDVSSRLTTEQILYNIKQEYKRMQKRRHLEASFQQADPGCTSDSQPHAFLISGPASPGTSSATSSPLKKEQPLFTLRQVGMICERLLKEREEKVREEYEEILNTKLAEQYDAFVKFTHDQIMRRYGEQPASYVSCITLFAFVGCLVPCCVVAGGPSCDIQQCQRPSVNQVISSFRQWQPLLGSSNWFWKFPCCHYHPDVDLCYLY